MNARISKRTTQDSTTGTTVSTSLDGTRTTQGRVRDVNADWYLDLVRAELRTGFADAGREVTALTNDQISAVLRAHYTVQTRRQQQRSEKGLQTRGWGMAAKRNGRKRAK